MSVCLCYHDEQNFLHERGVCYGTKEKEPCSCGGNPVKCDFYEEVREKYIHRTNYDRLVSKTPEELAAFLDLVRGNKGYPLYYTDWLDWLKQEAKE